MPELLASLALEGCIVTIDAMGTQPSIAQAIRDEKAASIRDFFALFQVAPDKTPLPMPRRSRRIMADWKFAVAMPSIGSIAWPSLKLGPIRSPLP